jgi:hypothetical protein
MSEGYVVIFVLFVGCVPTYNVSTQCLSPFGLREVHWTHQFIMQFVSILLQIELTTMIYLTESLLKYQLLKQIILKHLAWYFGSVTCNNDIASWNLWKLRHMPSNNTRCTIIVATMFHVMLCRLRIVWRYQRGNQNRIWVKNRQHNGKTKQYKRTNNDLQNIHIKLTIELQEPH